MFRLVLMGKLVYPCDSQSSAGGSLVCLAGSTMLDWSAGEGSDTTAPWSPRLGVGVRPAFSPRKTSPTTETPTRELQEIPCLGEEGSSLRRRIKSGGESLRFLEATGQNCLSLSRDTTIGTWNVRTMLQSGKAAQIDERMPPTNDIVEEDKNEFYD